MKIALGVRFKKRRNEIERLHQCALIEYLNLHKDKPLYHKNDNEGKRSRMLGAKLKAAGLVPGVPDLFIPEPRGKYHGLYIEMKSDEKSKLTKCQELFLDALNKRDYLAVVCYSSEDAIKVVNEYLSLK